MEFQELIDGARRGDEASFVVLWRTFNPRLLRFLAGLAGRPDAPDLASETWLDVVRNLNTFEGDESAFGSWIFTIARHRVIDLHRSRTADRSSRESLSTMQRVARSTPRS